MAEAALPLLTAAALLFVMVLIGQTAFYIPLAAGAAVAAGLAWRAGYTGLQLAEAGWKGTRSTLVALSILVLIGALIGVWRASGTVPAMIYYGLGFANPTYLLPAAFVLALITSMMLGTSIGTLSTLGVAIMGVAHGAGLPAAPVAGALVSGALFGDRSSPLSGSLNLNSAMTDNPTSQIVRSLVPTGAVTAAICLGLYGLAGATLTGAAGPGSALQATIGAQFAVTPWLMVPPVLVLGLALARVPVRQALGLGIAAGALLALRGGWAAGGAGLVAAVKAALFGFKVQTGDAALNKMLAGGGVIPMWPQILLILVAGAFNGLMETTGMMAVVISRLMEGLKRPVAIVGATMGVSVAVAMVAANQALAIIVPGRMLKGTYSLMGLPGPLLSRSLADSGTVIAGLLPWNLMGILAAASLGMPVSTFAPYAFLPMLLPLVSLAFTWREEAQWQKR